MAYPLKRKTAPLDRIDQSPPSGKVTVGEIGGSVAKA
jgi:hypothetical protein